MPNFAGGNKVGEICSLGPHSDPDCEIALVANNFIKVQVKTTHVWALVDTGAQVSAISQKLFEQLALHMNLEIEPSSLCNASTAAGNKMPILGQTQIAFNILNGKKRCYRSVYKFQIIPGLSHDLILGIDYLTKHKAKMDFSKGKVNLKTKYQVRVPDNVEIPSNTIMPIMCKLRTQVTMPHGLSGMFTGSQSLCGLGVPLAYSVSKVLPGNEVIVQVMNTLNVPFQLKRNTRVGCLEIFQSPEQVHLTVIDTDVTNDKQRGQVRSPVSDFTSPDKLRDIDLSQSDITAEEKHQLMQLLSEYSDIFANTTSELGKTNLAEHKIVLEEGHVPFRARPYRANPQQREEIENQIREMLDANIIKPSSSNYASPVVLVAKPGNKATRFCVDFRKINKITKTDAYTLPRIDDTLDSLGISHPTLFSVLDTRSGFWQCAMEESSKEYTAFTTHAGLYQFEVMPFGLKNAGSVWQRLMDNVLRGLNYKIALVYMDDIIVYSRSFQGHMANLRQVFDCLKSANLKLKPSKCSFMKNEVKYLGHIVSKEGLKPDPDKIKVIQNYPTPHNVKSLRQALGLFGYYRRFCEGYSKVASPLYALMKKQVPFEWTEECQQAFDALKSKLISPPILAYPDFNQKFVLYTDASAESVGMVLSQCIDGHERVISYAGRSLNKHQRNYSITEKELLAVILAFRHFAPYLRGRQFDLITDHQALKWLIDQKEPQGRLARWLMAVQEYQFTVIYKPGRLHSNVDPLSRINHEEVDEEEQLICPEMFALDEDTDRSDSTQPLLFNELKELQGKDSFCAPIIEYLKNRVLPEDGANARRLLKEIGDFMLVDGILYHLDYPPGKGLKKDRLVQQTVIPDKLVPEVLAAFHDEVTAGHLGIARTYQTIRQRYYWWGMSEAVKKYVQSCHSCQTRKRPGKANKAPLIPIPVESAWDRCVIDAVGPLTVTSRGNRYILVLSDYLTKYVEAIAVPDIKAETVARVLFDEIIARHSAPRVLLSDLGANFLSKAVKELCNFFDIKKINSTAYRPQTQGLCERFNSTLITMLSFYTATNQKDWDAYIPAVLFAYRISPATDSTLYSPFLLMYGREANVPADIMLRPRQYESDSVRDHFNSIATRVHLFQEIARNNIKAAQDKMKAHFDKTSTDININVGDYVFVHTPAAKVHLSKKLLHSWHGPYIVSEKPTPVNVKLIRASDNKHIPTRVHVNRVKLGYHRDIRPPDSLEPEVAEIPPGETDNLLNEDDFPQDSFQVENPGDEGSEQLDQQGIPVENSQPTATENVADDGNASEYETAGEESSCEEEEDTERYYEVEKIVKARRRKGKREFLIKWKGYPDSENTWEPESNMNEYAKQYLKQNPGKFSK